MNGDEYDGGGAAYVPDDHVGVMLRQRRVELGRELSEIAHQTRVPVRHLRAIEEGKHDSLPALPYTVGFVKSYARIIGLDPVECAERFRNETTKSDRVVPTTMINEPIEDSRVPTRGAVMAGIGLLAAIALGVVAYSADWFSGDEAPPAAADTAMGSAGGVPVAAETPAPPPVAAPAPPPVETTAIDPAAPVAAASGPIVIAAREDAWIKVYDKATGQSVFMGVMAAGDRYEVPAGREDLLLWTGRAGALDVSVGGTALPPLGAATETVRDVPLTAAGLAARRPASGG